MHEAFNHEALMHKAFNHEALKHKALKQKKKSKGPVQELNLCF